jgi:cyanate permease
MGAMFLICGGTGIFLLNQSVVAIYTWMILYGLGTGTFGNLIALTRGHYFGRKNFGVIHGTSMVLTPPFAAIAPIFAGWVYDKYQTYLPALALITGLIAVFALALVFARPPKPNQLSRIPNIS